MSRKKRVSRGLSILLTLVFTFGLIPGGLVPQAAADSDFRITSSGGSTLTIGGSQLTLTATGAPQGSTITWSSSNHVAIASSSGNSATIRGVQKGEGSITATATYTITPDPTPSQEPDPTPTQEPDPTPPQEPNPTPPQEPDPTPPQEPDPTPPQEPDPDPTQEPDVTGGSNERTAAHLDMSRNNFLAENTQTSINYTFNVTVKEGTVQVTSVTLNPTSLSMKLNESKTITATVAPTNANKTLTWNSNNSTVATVVNGTVTAKSAGTATITATAQDGSGKTATCTVTVTGGISLSSTSLSLFVSQTRTLSVTGAPTGASISWSSSAPSYASVDASSGKITAKAPGTTTITATVTANGTVYKPTCVVTVSSTKANNISYTSSNNGAVHFSASNFNSVCPTGDTLSYITFNSLPSSSQGTLYYNYTSSGNYDRAVSASTSYYYNKAYYIDSIAFVPNDNYNGTVTLNYTAQDRGNATYTGSVIITVGSGGDVTYTTTKNSPVTLDNGSFDDYVSTQTNSNTFRSIQFSTPASSKGTLYYNYTSSGNYDSKAGSSSYYRSSSPRLDDITFVPASNYSGTVSIPFSGQTGSGSTFSGSLVITVGKTEGAISYSTAVNTPVDFVSSDFNDYCRDQTDSALDYVTFSIPTASKGMLYYDYKTSSSTGTKVTDSTKYYRNSSPSVGNLTFVPASGYTGTISIPFSGRASNNSGTSFTGTVKIYIGTAKGDISYTITTGNTVTFKSDDFNDYSKSETSYNLDYVRFDIPASSKGVLYLNYNASKGTGTKVTSSTNYSRSGTNSLNNITFVPASGYTGAVSIDFTGRNTNGGTFTGAVGIQVAANQKADVVRYTSAGTPVNFQLGEFSRACDARGGGTLSQVVFSLPNTAYGTLYYNYTNATTFEGFVTAGTAYLRTGTPSLSNVTFVPKPGFVGTAILSYTGTDSTGSTYTGSIEIKVSAPVTPSVSKYFGDINSSNAWAASAVDYLYEAGVVKGVGGGKTFGASANISRGDFVLMLHRAFQFTATPSQNFPDVPSDSYYANEIAIAKTLGIAKGADNKFNPTGQLTRQDAMVLIQRAMQAAGKIAPDGAASLLSSYPDRSAVANYAQGAVAALVRDSIIQGDSTGRLNPKNPITRAEMAAILYRVLTR